VSHISGKKVTLDGNTAVANVAYAFSEVAAIYPITPSTSMGEMVDAWAAKNKPNMFGQPLIVTEMQSEAGAAGAIHGSLTAGAMTTTFTASQGLLLMIPNMHKIAGEMLPTVFHVAARSLAAQSLSIFCDHSDVMSVRNTGFAILSSNNVQEAQDLAVVSHLAAIESRVPFLHFFDGFRTSSQIEKIDQMDYDTMKSMLNMDSVRAFKARAISPEHPYAKVGAENPDVYFQGRETVNKYYDACPGIVKKYMDLFFQKTGRRYNLYDYYGAKDAEKIIISMGSSNDTIAEVVDYLNARGNKLGVLKVRLFRPFSVKDFSDAIPQSVKKIAVMDRTKEPGSIGEPLYLDVVAALKDRNIQIIGGRYGLSSKDFTPKMVKAVFDHLDKNGFHGFVVGIEDDVTHKSLALDASFHSEPKTHICCKFWGYGSDGTVSACKNAIKVIGESTDQDVQAYFSYDSKKAGGITISHLRFSKDKIRSQYLLDRADFISLHKPSYIGRYDILEGITEGGIFLLNVPWSAEDAFANLTEDMQRTIIEKKVRFYVIDAFRIADEAGLEHRINTIMVPAFFKLSGVLPEAEAVRLYKEAIEKTLKHKGMDVVQMNWNAVDKTFAEIIQVKIPDRITKSVPEHVIVKDDADSFARDIIKPIVHLKGDTIPVSKMPVDGIIPTGTSKIEKRGIAEKVPKWLPDKCIQCGFCAFVCPHAVIRNKQMTPDSLKDAPSSFKTIKSNNKNDKSLQFKVQVSIEDCTGCGNCVVECPVDGKALVMTPIEEERAAGEVDNWNFFYSLPDITDGEPINTIKGSQLITPLFEFHGACAGCGETPYIRLVTQLFGDRMVIANATGCSSIYGGTFPTVPYAVNKEGKGPAWANSLFEDNAEYGYGFRLAIDANRKQLRNAIEALLKSGTTAELTSALNKLLSVWEKTDSEAKDAAKEVLKWMPDALAKVYGNSEPILNQVNMLKDFLTDKSVWLIGGDGWAYDIGFGGLDHVMASGRKINCLVLDTEVYSNTGGQCSKATPRAATAKFAVAGKPTPKKNLALMLTTYRTIYVASIDMGANKQHALKALLEAESYPGPSIVIAYSPCIAHGINMSMSTTEAKLAGDSGYWPLFRFDPRLEAQGKNPFQWDSKEPSEPFMKYLDNELRYKSLKHEFPERADRLYKQAEDDAKKRFEVGKSLAANKDAPVTPQSPPVAEKPAEQK